MRTDKIEKSQYVGYLWKSDSPTPIVLNPAQEYEYIPVNSENPFIIEGLLYDEKNKISYSIIYVDGEYIINKYDIKELNQSEKCEKEFLAHPNIGSNIKLLFYEYWSLAPNNPDTLDSPDERYEGLSILKPAEFVFYGFQKVITNKSDSQK